MAVVPKHGNTHKNYDPKEDLTIDQIHRFTKVANRVQHEKDEQELLEKSSFESEAELEETLEIQQEQFVHQQLERAKHIKKRRRRKRLAYASLALSLAVLSMAIMALFG